MQYQYNIKNWISSTTATATNWDQYLWRSSLKTKEETNTDWLDKRVNEICQLVTL